MNYDDLTREERVHLMLTDLETYMAIVPPYKWVAILEPLAKMKPRKKEKDG